MATTSSVRIGPRDIEILEAIDRCPLTPAQLRELSRTFRQRFQDVNNLRRRLRILLTAGFLSCWPYAVASEGRSPRYFKLSREGFLLLHGKNAALPKRRHFEAIKPGHHWHTWCLAESIARICVAAHQHGHAVEHFSRENNLCLKAGQFTIYPDAAFDIVRSDGRTFAFCLVLDNGTERVRSKQDVECIERKLRGYDAHNTMLGPHDPERYIAVFVTTRSQQRLKNIMDTANCVMPRPNRTGFIGTNLATLSEGDPFADALFEDHRGLRRTLIPAVRSQGNTKQSAQHSRQTVVV